MTRFPGQLLDGTVTKMRHIPVDAIDGSEALLLPPAPALDNSAKSALQTTLASGTPFTWSSGDGADGAYGIVFVNCSSALMDLGATAVVTWGGVTMSSKGSAYRGGGVFNGWGWVFVLNGIPGGDQTISVTLTQAGKTFTGWGSSYSFINVGSVGALQIATGNSTSPSVTVSAAGTTDIVWGVIAGGVLSVFSLAPLQIASASPLFEAGDITGSTSVAVSGTQSASSVWAAFGLDLIGITSALDSRYLNKDTTGNAATATKLATARNINGVAFDGTAAITVADSTKVPNLVPTALKTSAYTAAVNDLVLMNGGNTVTLPTAAADKSRIAVKKMDASGTTVTIAAGGSDVFNVAGGSTTLTLVLQYQASVLQYNASASVWYVVSTDAPLGGLDTRYLNQNTTGTAAGITGKTTPTGALVGTTDTQALTNKDLTGSGNTFPTLNQNTTGTAAGVTGKTTPTGAFVGTTDTQALTNKDLTGAGNTFPTFNQNTTGTAAGITGKTTPTGAIVGTTDTQTLTNKTLTTPAISSPTGLVKADVGLGNVDNTSDATKTATLDARYEPLESFIILQSAYTLASQTAAQQLFNTTTNGAITLPVGDYFFECGFALTSMSATSGSFGFAFGGTAIITQAWAAVATKGLSLISANPVMTWATANTAALINSSTNTIGATSIKGRITVTTAGTLIPQTSLTVAAAAIVGAGAYFRIQGVNSTAAFAGSWS